jgi:hypothetical protein
MLPTFKKRCPGLLPGNHVPSEMICVLQFILQFLKEAIPRTLIAHETRPPLLVFTDAALEGNDAFGSVGGVLIDRSSSGPQAVRQFFAAEVVGSELKKFQTDSTKVITVLEVLPVVTAIRCWQDRMLHRRVFVFIDIDGARLCLINMSCKSGHF